MRSDNAYENNLSELRAVISEAEYLKYTIGSLIYWDKITYMPPNGLNYRTKVMSYLSDAQYRLLSGQRFSELVDYFDGNPDNDEKTDAMIRRIKRNAYYSSAIPEDEYRDYIELIAVAEHVWEKAREENDFEKFRPYLEKIFATFRKFAVYWGGGKDIYDALMGYYEDGLTTDTIDEMVSSIKPFLMEIVRKKREADRDTDDEKKLKPLFMPVSDQERIWRRALEKLGFDFDGGRIDKGAHPTVLANSPDDVRIVNSCREEDFGFGFTNILHSAGMGIYQQSISRNLLGSFLAEAPSFAIEESIGLLYENILGKSLGFIKNISRDVCDVTGKLDRTPLDVFKRLNTVRPSAIRINSDEFTYLLHIIARYEIERDVINGRITAGEIPRIWNEKYEEYLGVTPADDREGVLQDIHWAGGYVGYFPSYIIANLASAQFKAAMEEELGSLDRLSEEGRFFEIRKWLTDRVFSCGAVYTAKDLIERATGEPLRAEYYVDYLRNKLSEVYISAKQSVSMQ